MLDQWLYYAFTITIVNYTSQGFTMLLLWGHFNRLIALKSSGDFQMSLSQLITKGWIWFPKEYFMCACRNLPLLQYHTASLTLEFDHLADHEGAPKQLHSVVCQHVMFIFIYFVLPCVVAVCWQLQLDFPCNILAVIIAFNTGWHCLQCTN